MTEMKLINRCQCGKKEKEERRQKLLNAFRVLKKKYPSIMEFERITISESKKVYWRQIRTRYFKDDYVYQKAIVFSCSLLEQADSERLKSILLECYFNSELNDRDGIEYEDEEIDEETEEECTGDCQDEYIQYCADCRCPEECCAPCRGEDAKWVYEYRRADNLTRAAMRLEKVRKIAYPIEIVQDRDVNGMADDDRGKILITSAAAEQLSEGELAFIISHEEAHLQGEHRKKSRELREFCKEKAKEVASDERSGNFAKGILLTTIVAASAVSVFVSPKLHEIEADAKAKERMLAAGYSKRDVTKFFDNYPGGRWGLLKPHPPQSFRKEILE